MERARTARAMPQAPDMAHHMARYLARTYRPGSLGEAVTDLEAKREAALARRASARTALDAHEPAAVETLNQGLRDAERARAAELYGDAWARASRIHVLRGLGAVLVVATLAALWLPLAVTVGGLIVLQHAIEAFSFDDARRTGYTFAHTAAVAAAAALLCTLGPDPATLALSAIVVLAGYPAARGEILLRSRRTLDFGRFTRFDGVVGLPSSTGGFIARDLRTGEPRDRSAYEDILDRAGEPWVVIVLEGHRRAGDSILLNVLGHVDRQDPFSEHRLEHPYSFAPTCITVYTGLDGSPNRRAVGTIFEERAHEYQAFMDAAGALAYGYLREEQIRAALLRLKGGVDRRKARIAAWEGLYLPDDVADRLLASLELFRTGDPASPRGTLLTGPPGTGKTELARRLAADAGVRLIHVQPSDLKAEHQGGTEARARKLWSDVREKRPAILFIDECEAVFSERTASASDTFDKGLTRAMIAEWDGMDETTGIWVIGATNRPEALDDAALDRFGETIPIPPPDAPARGAILADALADKEVDVPVDDELLAATGGLRGRQLVRAASLARRNALSHDGPPTAADVTEALRQVRGRSGAVARRAPALDDLVLPDATREALDGLVALVRGAERIRESGLSLPTGALFWGPPGTGKTITGRALARETGAAFHALNLADLKGAVLGDSVKNVERAFRRARESSPSILFIDEIDAVAADRGDADKYEQEMVTALLQEMDGVHRHDGYVLLVGTTNRIGDLDPAFRSRLTYTVEFPAHDREALAEILSRRLARLPLGEETDPDALAERVLAEADGFSARAVEQLIARATTRAALRAGDDEAIALTADDLLRSIHSEV